MRLIIIPFDDNVSVDGVWKTLDLSGLRAAGIHAVQWHDAEGEIEYTAASEGGRRNESISTIEAFQPLIDAWAAAPVPFTVEQLPK